MGIRVYNVVKGQRLLIKGTPRAQYVVPRVP